MYDVTTDFTEDFLNIIKDNVEAPETRSKRGSVHVLEYETGSKYVLEGSSYFHNILRKDKKAVASTKAENFICNLVLPLPVVGSLIEVSRCRFGKRKFVKVFGKPVEQVLAGSLSEGLSLPEIIHIKVNSSLTEIPDQDQKYIFHEFIVSDKNKNSFAIIEPTFHSPPAFVKLRLNKNYNIRNDLNTDLFLNKEGFILRDKFILQLKENLKKYVETLTPEGQSVKCKDGHKSKVYFSKHGPATTVDVADEFNTLFSTDHVICLPCPSWPSQAKGWPKRTRSWPSKGLVKKIVREGCHVVAKGKLGSKDEREQFSFSFSLCDKTLSKAMTLNQKRCYMLFKYIFKFYLNKTKRGLTSFVCKTTFLWLSESKPDSYWNDDSLFVCVIALLEKLKNYLELHCLPHFYITEFNLIEHLTVATTKVCIKDITNFLQTPWQILLQLTESHRFRWLSKDISLQDILRKLTERINLKQEVFIAPCLLNFFSELLDKGEGLLVLSIVCKDWQWSSNVQLNTRQCIRHLEEVIAMLDGYGNLVCLQGLLGNLYHQLSYETGNINFFKRSMNILQEAQHNAGKHIWIYACFYDLLQYSSECDLVLRHFLSRVRSKSLYTSGIYTVLSNYNCNTGFNFAEIFGHAVIPTTAYILFQVVSAYIGLAQSSNSLYMRWLLQTEAFKVLKHLRQWTSRKCRLYSELFDDQLNYMVGLAAKIVGDRDIAFQSYKEAVSYGISVLGVDLDDLGQIPVVPDYLLAKPRGSFDHKLLRFQPYRKTKRGHRVGLPKELTFVKGRPHVGRYRHF